MSETLDQKLAALKLGRMRQVYASWIEQAVHSELGYAEFLEQLVTEELLARQENHLRRKMKAAGFPYPATIEQFDFSLRPELKRSVLMRFLDSSFVTNASSLLLIGPSGLGKAHLAISVGAKLVQVRYSVRSVVAQRLLNAVLTTTHDRHALPTPIYNHSMRHTDRRHHSPSTNCHSIGHGHQA